MTSLVVIPVYVRRTRKQKSLTVNVQMNHLVTDITATVCYFNFLPVRNPWSGQISNLACLLLSSLCKAFA